MKIVFPVLVLSFLLTVVSCKKNTTETTVDKNQTETHKQRVISRDSIITKNPIVPKEHYEYFFVSARSGLNYRDLPKGEVLGKFPLNTQLKVIAYPKVLDQIIENDTILKGEWLGVEHKKDTVYVFSRFMSLDYTFSDLKLYRTSPFYKENNEDIRTGFLNLSESYFTGDYYTTENEPNRLLLSERDLKKDTITLNPAQRKQFLKSVNINDSDLIFVYEIKKDVIHSYKVKDLPAIACLNIYFDSYNQATAREYDYEFGLDLKNNYTGDWENFTYVGNYNPFKKGELKPIIWKKADTTIVRKNLSTLINSATINLSALKIETAYLYKQDDLEYYLLNNNRLIVVNKKEQRMVYNNTYHWGESASLTAPKMENDTINDVSQHTGKLFKNKPSVVFGFQYFSFGCESINFLEETEPSIGLLCDNRH